MQAMLPPQELPSKDFGAEKARLRAAALARRAEMGALARARAADAAVARAMASIPAFHAPRGRRIALFASFRDEIDTLPLARALWARGALLALPVIVGRGMPLLFRAWHEGAELAPAGAFRILTPGPECPEVVPDALLVPLAAFDRRGLRIGYGGGFYDRTLAGLRRRGPVTAVGFAFACQQVDAVPAEPHDEAVDVMVTESETFSAAADTGS
ncbi:5-formyltetrahydrofolate cyclo-ligase [Xanthobacter sp. V0B-10]|uniref:5-formyltetrahydrofolate cyclo-ligase n=2 Tax=Xanthobacter albus TaxID=3119929 RepID=UPI003726ED34